MFKKEINGKNNTKASKEAIVLFFCIVLIILVLFALFLIFSKIEIIINNIKISIGKSSGYINDSEYNKTDDNYKNKINDENTDRTKSENINKADGKFLNTKKYLDENYNIQIRIRILDKINILKININKEKLDKYRKKHYKKIKQDIEKLKQKAIRNIDKIDSKITKGVKQLNAKLEHLDLKVYIGTVNAALTSYLAAGVASVTGILLKNKITDINKQKFIVTPIYTNENSLKMELNCIISIKMIHIIYIIYIMTVE